MSGNVFVLHFEVLIKCFNVFQVLIKSLDILWFMDGDIVAKQVRPALCGFVGFLSLSHNPLSLSLSLSLSIPRDLPDSLPPLLIFTPRVHGHKFVGQKCVSVSREEMSVC